MSHSRILFRIKRIFILIFLFFIFFSICAIRYVNTVSANIGDNLFRLHIIANSNSREDQNLKYKVRDKLIEYMNTLVSTSSSKEEAITIASSHIQDFEEIAKKIILENGFNYPVSIEIGNFEFPTKQYGDISLPAGLYDAMRVKIGKAEGQNWWCVMFPPLCFVDVSSGIVPEESKDVMKKEMSEEEYFLISSDSPEIKFKFKLLELFGSIANIQSAKK